MAEGASGPGGGKGCRGGGTWAKMAEMTPGTCMPVGQKGGEAGKPRGGRRESSQAGPDTRGGHRSSDSLHGAGGKATEGKEM